MNLSATMTLLGEDPSRVVATCVVVLMALQYISIEAPLIPTLTTKSSFNKMMHNQPISDSPIRDSPLTPFLFQQKLFRGFPIFSALDISVAFFSLRVGGVAFMGNVSCLFSAFVLDSSCTRET